MKKLEYNQLIQNKPVITPSKIAKNMVKLLEKELSFEDKQKIVRAVIEKVEATPTEATIYGRIPIYEGIDNDLITFNEKEVNVGFKTKDSNLINLNQHITEKGSEKCENSKKFTSGQVGFEFKDRNRRLAKCGEIYTF